MAFGKGTWQQPWVRLPPGQEVETPGWIVDVNDVRVHSPRTRDALVIPPESRISRGSVTDRLHNNSKELDRIRGARHTLQKRSVLQQIATRYRCSVAEVENAIEELDAGYPSYGQVFTPGRLYADEFRALAEPISDLDEDEDFVTEHHTDDWRRLGAAGGRGDVVSLIRAVDRIVGVRRVKAIQVFEGFRRVRLTGKMDNLVPPDVTDESEWLPAQELYGEGIFFTLAETKLQRWETDSELEARARPYERRYVAWAGPDGHRAPDVEVSPRLLLCHTLAHLMIRAIEAQAGYPAASLKERIYCGTGSGSSAEPRMAGILIYVAVPDQEGSLGGLMELAEPQRFLRLVVRAFESASWCSLDPVCSEREGHGPGLLNRAACHACAFLPETSCQYGNVLLDRAFLTGLTGLVPPFSTAVVDKP